MIQAKDMTTGSYTKLIVAFAMPILAGNLFQQAYTLVDTIILGRKVSTEALTAVSCTSWIYWLAIGIITGFTQGFSILISQYFGAGKLADMRKSVTMSAFLSIVITIVTALLSLLFMRRLLVLLQTPDNVIDMAELYLDIVIGGIFITMLYNLLSSILRAVGDSKTSLIALIVSSLVNIILDYIFVAYFHLGVTGVATATLIAQVVSCIICMISIHKISILRLSVHDWTPDKTFSITLFQMGAPLALQNIVISIGGLIMQGIINSYGYLFTAGFSLTGKVTNLIQQAGTSFAIALGTFVGQNLGAKKYTRIKECVLKCLKINLCVGIGSGFLFILIGKPVLSMFLTVNSSSSNVEIIEIAYHYLVIQCIFLFFVYILFTYRAALLGMGRTFVPMLSGIVELVIRLLVALLLPLWIGRNGIFYADVVAWFGAGMLLMVSYYRVILKIGCQNKNALQTPA